MPIVMEAELFGHTHMKMRWTSRRGGCDSSMEGRVAMRRCMDSWGDMCSGTCQSIPGALQFDERQGAVKPIDNPTTEGHISVQIAGHTLIWPLAS